MAWFAAGQNPGHHVIALRWLDRVARQGREPRRRRGRSEAKSLDDDEASPTIRFVMPRLAYGCVHIVSSGTARRAPPTGMSVSGASSAESYVFLGVLLGRFDDALCVIGSGAVASF